MLASIVRDLERYVRHPTTALKRTVDRIAYQIAVHGCDVLRRAAAYEFVHASNAYLNLLAEKVTIFSSKPVQPFGDGRGRIQDGFGIARRPLSCLLRLVSR